MDKLSTRGSADSSSPSGCSTFPGCIAVHSYIPSSMFMHADKWLRRELLRLRFFSSAVMSRKNTDKSLYLCLTPLSPGRTFVVLAVIDGSSTSVEAPAFSFSRFWSFVIHSVNHESRIAISPDGNLPDGTCMVPELLALAKTPEDPTAAVTTRPDDVNILPDKCPDDNRSPPSDILPDSRSENLPESRSDIRSESRSDILSESRSDIRPERGSSPRPATRSDTLPDNRSDSLSPTNLPDG
mmetsp:Transcript_4370/g.8606  ORF Transcript_4370/g.8606 Transcript_4370/m.8606 type:complete len:240 (+) Transcript_4370:136-855(+)